MASNVTRVISARVPIEVAEFYREVDVRAVLTEVANGSTERVYTELEGVNTLGVNTKSEAEIEIESLCDLVGISTESFYEQIREMFLDGRLLVENGVVLTSEGEVLRRFKEACAEKGKDFEETLEKFTQMVWNERTGGGAGA